MQRWLLQKGSNHIYHYTPIQAAKLCMVEISQEQVDRIRDGEDPAAVIRMAEDAAALKDHTMIAVPNSMVARVNEFIANGAIEEVKYDPSLTAKEEFKDVPAADESDDDAEAPNLRSVEVIKIEKTTSKNVVEEMNSALPKEFRADINREMDMKDMKTLVIAGYEKMILAGG